MNAGCLLGSQRQSGFDRDFQPGGKFLDPNDLALRSLSRDPCALGEDLIIAQQRFMLRHVAVPSI